MTTLIVRAAQSIGDFHGITSFGCVHIPRQVRCEQQGKAYVSINAELRKIDTYALPCRPIAAVAPVAEYEQPLR